MDTTDRSFIDIVGSPELLADLTLLYGDPSGNDNVRLSKAVMGCCCIMWRCAKETTNPLEEVERLQDIIIQLIPRTPIEENEGAFKLQINRETLEEVYREISPIMDSFLERTSVRRSSKVAALPQSKSENIYKIPAQTAAYYLSDFMGSGKNKIHPMDIVSQMNRLFMKYDLELQSEFIYSYPWDSYVTHTVPTADKWLNAINGFSSQTKINLVFEKTLPIALLDEWQRQIRSAAVIREFSDAKRNVIELASGRPTVEKITLRALNDKRFSFSIEKRANSFTVFEVDSHMFFDPENNTESRNLFLGLAVQLANLSNSAFLGCLDSTYPFMKYRPQTENFYLFKLSSIDRSPISSRNYFSSNLSL